MSGDWVAIIVGALVAQFGASIMIGRPARAFNQQMSLAERRMRGLVCLGVGLLIVIAFAFR